MCGSVYLFLLAFLDISSSQHCGLTCLMEAKPVCGNQRDESVVGRVAVLLVRL